MSSAERYTLETPENIEVDFELAGLGSRFCATLIDTLLIVAIGLGIALLAMFLAVGTLPSLGAGRGHWVTWVYALVLGLLVALMAGGYYVLFELFMRGQTPGKKAMKIRVIRDDGTPVTANEVLVRNILRLVDFLPGGYALGAVCIFVHPLAKRLGDLAAGTIVVKEGHLDYRATTDNKYEVHPELLQTANAELTPEERRLVTGFLQRRAELLPQARLALAERLAGPLHEKYGGHYGQAEEYILRLVEGRHYEP
jgi:uncharacterized RDD family membrane protein YckC